MTQEMHTWIATALVVITVNFFLSQHKFNKVDNKNKLIAFFVDWIGILVFLSILLYRIS